jgi:1,4-alpha-glucan branching enzyme
VIRIKELSDTSVKVTFVVDDDGRPTSVVGCFNNWDPGVNPLRRRRNGTRSVSVKLSIGSTIRFRYAVTTEVGLQYVDDPDAHGFEPNGFGQTHSLLHLTSDQA